MLANAAASYHLRLCLQFSANLSSPSDEYIHLPGLPALFVPLSSRTSYVFYCAASMVARVPAAIRDRFKPGKPSKDSKGALSQSESAS